MKYRDTYRIVTQVSRYVSHRDFSTAHRSGDLFINAAITQLATCEVDVTFEQPSFGQKVGQCSSGEV